MSISPLNLCKKYTSELFTFPPRTKKQKLAWESGSILGAMSMAEANLGRVNTQNARIINSMPRNSALISRSQYTRLKDITRCLQERQDTLEQALHNLRRETNRLHTLAKEVLENDKK